MSIDAGTSVLFDLDGVLIDSRSAISRCINHALDAQGLAQQPLASLERFIGPQLTLAFAELTGQTEDSELVLACLASYRARYAEASLRETTVIAEIPGALAALSGSYRLAVATSKPRAFAEPLLASLDLRHRFELIAAPELDAHHEDKAATIRSALSALRATRAVMVGDRSFDIIGAHACEMPAIGVTWGIGSTGELLAAGAEVIIDSPSELPHAVESLLG
ncbi:MAG TPA: HAD hydrolase-like protein [Solirubrobacteraceae bacterium]|nr:HAD hydrolase-like protein [Solirubrobacteraceae bacterium]